MAETKVILGVNTFHADSSACLIINGELISAIEEERLNRVKHYAGFPSEAIKECLSIGNIKEEDITDVAFNTKPLSNLIPKGIHFLKNLSLKENFAKKRFLKKKNIHKIFIEKLNLNQNVKFHYIEHHLAHIASAYYPSKFKKANGLSIDGSGDFVSLAYAKCENNKIIIKKKNDTINKEDKIYIIINSSQMAETLDAFGHNEKISKKILIIGGGNIGFNLAKNLEETLDSSRVKIIEKDKIRAEFLANELNNTIIINGNGLEEEVLTEANLEEAETVLALTNDDEDNLMVSVLVEKFTKDNSSIEDKRTMALINKPNYSLLQNSLKIDDLIDPRMNTVSSILKHVHKGTIETAYTILNGEYEVIEADIIETSELINQNLKDSNLPDEIRIGAVLRNGKIIIPRSDFTFQKKDTVVFLAKKDAISIVENLFRISSI